VDGGRALRLERGPRVSWLALVAVMGATLLGLTCRASAEEPPCTASAIVEGQPAQGVLDETDCPSSQGQRFLSDRHQFTGVAGQRVVIAAESGTFRPFLVLIREADARALARAGPVGSVARLPVGLGAFKLPADGTYVIEVTADRAGAAGAYRLTLGTPCDNQAADPRTQCDDGNGCTHDTCDWASICSHTFRVGPCNDGDACTHGDACVGGQCLPGFATDCEDGNPCTDDSCDPAAGCRHADNVAPCNDNDACTTDDTCAGGRCAGGPPLDCEDGNPCTGDGCKPEGGCVHTNVVAPCDDENACTTADKCVGGRCVGGTPLGCDDGNGCTDDTCAPEAGCQHRNNAAPCDDADACTAGDRCAAGRCASGAPVGCDDGNPCTDDRCEPRTGCVHGHNTASCDDGNACTTGDGCARGRCASSAPVGCDDGNPCTDDRCDPQVGCVRVDNRAPCDDGNACTTGDVCTAGRCASGAAVGCDDGNPCTDDRCDPQAGCVRVNNAASCDDGNACTTGDTCAAGRCVGGPAPDCDDANPCTADRCTPRTGCVHVNTAGRCDDANACTTADRCVGGRCVGGRPLDCDDRDRCTDDGCDPEAGCLHTSNDAPCNDGDACTTGDRCADGRCVGGAPPACDDGNACTDDGCTPAKGCTHTPNAAPCDDGSACTTGDTCARGKCAGGARVSCDDGNPCTDDACERAAGCTHAGNRRACDDGNACTRGDTCADGQCVSGALLACDDRNPCTDDSCAPATGCVHAPNAAPCDDGSACTTGDVCAAGRCVGAAALDCDDGNPCTDDRCDPKKGCVSSPNRAPCDDGNACTTEARCAGGRCAGGLPRRCDDRNVCTDDRCEPAAGCVHTDNAAPCEDGSRWTTGDRCAGGRCGSGAPPDCDDGNVCTDDSFDRTRGCVHAGNTAPCDDGNACTTRDVCARGRCTGGPAIACDDGNACTTDRCDARTGCGHVDNSAPCDDRNACTRGDACAAGRCAAGAPVGCDDGNACTDDACDPAAGCRHDPNDATCDDADACTTGDRCAAGRCAGVPSLDCDDGNPCTDDRCDRGKGCVSTPNRVPCDDGDACTTEDRCAGGRCAAGPRQRCDDRNVCTDDTCEPAAGCVHAANTAPCEDGSRWTTGDRCTDGRCGSGSGPDCNDGNPCTDDAPDPARGCVHASNQASCDDGNACTTGDVCARGRCTGGQAVGCDDGNPCTDDTCDRATGCRYAENAAKCDDGNLCTRDDRCADRRCAGGPPRDCDDDKPCTDDTCAPAIGCVHIGNTAACDDDDPCTTGDRCAGRQCVGGPPLRCDDGNICTDDWCERSAGCVHTSNDDPCDDQNACTIGDACGAGKCGGGRALPCDDGNVCTRDGCEPLKGCVYEENTGECDDGNACTVSDVCADGRCAGGPPRACDDGNSCTTDACAPATGCVHTGNAALCDDQNACTTGDRCAGGRCVAGQAVGCDDGNACSDDACDPAQGCIHRDNAASCDDGDACTTGDRCGGGRCVSGRPADCEDGNPCTEDGCDAAAGCTHAPRPECVASCGDVGVAPCTVTVSSSSRRFTDLQAAIDAAADGATISVEGMCAGPVTIARRVGLTVQGVPPAASGCPADGLSPGDLRSTIRGGDRAIGVRRSRDIEIRYLNLVDAETNGLELSEVEGSRATCNCVARSGTAGITLFAGRDNAVQKNLVTRNAGVGIRLRQATESAIAENVVRENRSGGIGLIEADRNTLERNAVRENAAAGIELDDSNRNVLRENTVHRNAADGLDLETADRNELVDNEVEGNGRDAARDSGIELGQSHRNIVGRNVIRENADRLTDQVRCRSGSGGNDGSNVPRNCSLGANGKAASLAGR